MSLRNLVRGLLALALVLTVTLGGTTWYLFFRGGEGENVSVIIPRGSTGLSVANRLTEDGVIDRPTLFRVALKLTGGGHHLRAGEFEFRRGSSIAEAVRALYSSEPILHKITVPEGWTVRLIADLLEKNQLADAKKFIALALGPEGPRKYELRAPTLEGYLYPDTYKFSKIDGEERILDTMVKRFFTQVPPGMREEAKQMGFTLEQWVTLASVVEKETGAPQERPLISSVFHNRLKKHMRLESDPTTIYGIENFDGNLTKKHLLTLTPYNTYKIPGLPPGAICSPGLASLQATLHPAVSNYLYFVASKSGQSLFSETYEKHARLVDEHQKRRGRMPLSVTPAKKATGRVAPKKGKKKNRRR